MRSAFKIAGAILIVLGLAGAAAVLVSMSSGDVSIWFKVLMGIWMVALEGGVPVVIGIELFRCEAASISRAAGQAAGLTVWLSLGMASQKWDLIHRWGNLHQPWISDPTELLNMLINLAVNLAIFGGPIWLGIVIARWVRRKLAPVLAHRLAASPA